MVALDALGHAAAAANAALAAGDFHPKLREVFTRVDAEIGHELLYSRSARDTFWKTVHETFPMSAAQYYAEIKDPTTMGEIDIKLNRRQYQSPQEFADVSGGGRG